MSLDEVETRIAASRDASWVVKAIVTLAEAWRKGGVGPNEMLHPILAGRRSLGETPEEWIGIVHDAQAFLWELGA